jgi:hypothetical protein
MVKKLFGEDRSVAVVNLPVLELAQAKFGFSHEGIKDFSLDL